ncbi:hypothetical protein B0T21DRAFT_422353 [Apiosordaria backusii]|uniref:Uncharacterized protein n=1 Tax=Apiosordaria backusii TaxID=314023 RepID=A0AA40E6A1_9PEZI|nr:hypothetical protein B0T21DRAFT_422353 [Apiosordaria backusii]
MWKFTADGSGGGSWSKENKVSSVALSRNIRTTFGAWTQSKDVGYWLSGSASWRTDTSIVVAALGDDSGKVITMPGITEFKMTTGELTNSSSAGVGPFGTLVGGAAQHVPFGAGPEALLIFMGGKYAPFYEGSEDQIWADFTNLTVYDTREKKWYWQQTTGARPTPRDKFCVVGVRGNNGTYEIFIYGGRPFSTMRAVGEIYVLSLPGFIFFQASPESPNGANRDKPSCVLAGKRQMITVEGNDGSLGFPNSLLDPDPWSNGLGVFDLARLAWSNRYDAKAEDYESPVMVREWYAQGSLASVVWSSN